MSMYRKSVAADGSFIEPVLECPYPGLTKQSMKAECDINGIMKRYEKTGVLQHVRNNVGFYDDVSSVVDYQASLEIVRKAEDMFRSLPAKIRSRFENDPQQYVDFVLDPANKDELIAMGVMRSEVVEAGKPPVVVPNVVPAKDAPPAPGATGEVQK